MDAGALDRRLEIWRAAIVDDGFGQVLGEPAWVCTIWGSKRDVSDLERFGNGQTEATMTTRFQVRWSSLSAAILPSDTLRCDGRSYGVVGIKEISRKVGLEITARADVQ
jgi:head-tail adaptor